MRTYTLRELLRIRNGKDHKHLADGLIPVYGSGGFMRNANKAIYSKESILLPRKGTLSNIQWVDHPFWTVDTIYYTEIDSALVDGYYLYSYLKCLDLKGLNSGTGVPSMTFEAYYNIRVQLPQLSVQKNCTSRLKRIEEKINVNNKINSELESMAKLIYDYWFVQFDFPDENGKPYKSAGGKMVYSDELKREIPKGWEVKHIQDIGTCIMGQSPKGESYNKEGNGIPLLNGPADYENGSLCGRTFTTLPTRLCQKDDLVLCIRATIGNLVYAESEFCLGRGVAAVRPRIENSSEYVYYLLENEIEVFKIRATGSIIKGITKDDLTLAKVPLPKSDLLKAFSNIIKPQFDKIRFNKRENAELTKLRDWLLPMLMNGQITIKD